MDGGNEKVLLFELFQNRQRTYDFKAKMDFSLFLARQDKKIIIVQVTLSQILNPTLSIF